MPSFIDPNDFFADIDRKKAKPAAVPNALDPNATTVDPPEITGLREAPPPDPICEVVNLSTDTLETGGLIDKAALDDGAYHGNMQDVDELYIDTSSLRDELPEAPAEEE
ncbi:MAG: hypothetical protein K2K44_04490 [Oscillospiraceae bacterium]|nr:hypothetical protein [Oscillospiraceae bacterium]